MPIWLPLLQDLLRLPFPPLQSIIPGFLKIWLIYLLYTLTLVFPPSSSLLPLLIPPFCLIIFATESTILKYKKYQGDCLLCLFLRSYNYGSNCAVSWTNESWPTEQVSMIWCCLLLGDEVGSRKGQDFQGPRSLSSVSPVEEKMRMGLEGGGSKISEFCKKVFWRKTRTFVHFGGGVCGTHVRSHAAPLKPWQQWSL